jgi:hypothetical protein
VALNSKVHVTQIWPNLEKRPPFLQFSPKLSDFFLVKDLTNCLFILFLFFLVSFCEHTFFARMRRLKNGCPLSALPRPSSIILNFPKTFLVKADIKQLSPKTNLTFFDEN